MIDEPNFQKKWEKDMHDYFGITGKELEEVRKDMNNFFKKTKENLVPGKQHYGKKIDQWVKDKKGRKVGYLIAQNINGEFRIGFSKCHTKLDEFNENSAKKIAKERLYWDEPEIPLSLVKPLKKFINRSTRYFKDCKYSENVMWIESELP